MAHPYKYIAKPVSTLLWKDTVTVVVSPEAILGLDFLKKHNITVDLGKSQLNLGVAQTTKSVPISETKPQVSQGSVSLEEQLQIPPLSEQVVVARVQGDCPAGACLIEKPLDVTLPCALARVLVEPKNGKVPIRPKARASINSCKCSSCKH